ncbi:MAG: amidohydrolase [Victivallaceae bacterium]
MKNYFLQQIIAAVEPVKQVAAEIYAHPELGRSEFQAVALQKDYLCRLGADFVDNYVGQPTAFRAEFPAIPTSKPIKQIAFMSEYDALPGMGHACGHNLVAAVALLAFSAVAKTVAEFKLPGGVVLLGTPAEEREGGKVDILRGGGFKGIDAVFSTHPYHASGCDVLDLAVNRFDVDFYGVASHAASAPELGINALDAATLLLNGISCWRQQLPRGGMVHGIITSGGTAANIIPAHSSLFFYLRSESDQVQHTMVERFKKIVEGAAMMTGCRGEITSSENPYRASVAYPELIELCRSGSAELGIRYDGEIEPGFSTDYANVSAEIPGVNYLFDITDQVNIPLHSLEFQRLAGSDAAFENAVTAAKVIGWCAVKYLLNEDNGKII